MNEGTANLITIGVALVGSLFALTLPRRFALVPLAMSLCLYPSNVLMPPDGAGLNAQRVIGLCLLIRCLSSAEIRGRFRWGLVDWVAAAYYTGMFVAQLTSTEFSAALVNRAGFFLAAMVPFWCARFLLVDKESVYGLLYGWLLATPILVWNAVNFMKTGETPYYDVMQYGLQWFGPQTNARDQRELWGTMYFRAHAPFQQCIMFGWFFALWLAPCVNLFWKKRSLFPWILGWVFMPVGIISAISGGPNALAGLSLMVTFLFPLRGAWKPAVWALVLAFVGLTLFGNRGPMEILADQGMDASSSWYRVGLVRQVTQGHAMQDLNHWVLGFGDIPASFGRFHDICIEWIYLLVKWGLLGLVGFYSLVIVCGYQLWVAKKYARSLEDQFMLWSLMATLAGAGFALMVVSLFSEMEYIFHIFLALLANAPLWIGNVRYDAAGRMVEGGTGRMVAMMAERNGEQVMVRYNLGPNQRIAIVKKEERN